MTAYPVNHFAFEIAKAAVNCVLREFAESGFWICMDPAIFKISKVSSTFLKVQNLMSDEVVAETGDVFITFQNSTSCQSWHSSAHACTSSWLTNAERDAPVASVKVTVSASCLRGKRPSASSKLLRYLESQPMRYTFHIRVFHSMLHDSNQTQD